MEMMMTEDGARTEGSNGRSLARRRWRLVLSVPLVVLLAWIAYAATLALEGRDHLQSAESRLAEANEVIAAADPEAAMDLLSRARQDLSASSRALNNPALTPIRFLPLIGDDLQVAYVLANGGSQLADDAFALADGLLDGDGALGDLTPRGGVLPVGFLVDLADSLASFGESTQVVLDDLDAHRPSGLVNEVVDAHQRALDLLAPVAEQSAYLANLVEESARFLGADGDRTYLLGASNPAELRGTGGLVGSITSLEIREGELTIGEFTAASDLPELEPTAIPPPVPEDSVRWSRYGGTGEFRNLNMTADFPSAAQAMLAHLEVSVGANYDGVVVVDPFALETLLALSGPAVVPRYDVTLTTDNVVDFVLNEAYAVFEDPDERKEILGAAAAATLQGFLESEAPNESPVHLIDRLSELVAGGHVLLYSTDAATQAAWADVGVDGGLGLQPGERSGEFLAVALNNGSANKVDFFTESHLDLHTTLLEDGSTRSELLLEVRNLAPTEGHPTYVIGPNVQGLEAGDASTNIRLYLAPDAWFEEVPEPDDEVAWTERELGHPVHEQWRLIRAGESTMSTYRWRTSDAWSLTPDGHVDFELVLRGQTVVRPTVVRVTTDIPAGMALVGEPPTGTIDVTDEQVTWEGSTRGEDLRLSLRFELPTAPEDHGA